MGSESIGRWALLLSGGMDSTALAWHLRPNLAITVDYGQLAAKGEIQAAAAVCDALGLHHRVVTIDCRAIGSGDMAGTEPIVLAPVSEWWPFRNQLLITIAAAVAVREGMGRLAIGAVANDASHADGRAEFVKAMSEVLQLQEGGLILEAPAIDETTVQLCERTSIPRELLAWSHSCHASEYACGICRGCVKHRETMRTLGYGEY